MNISERSENDVTIYVLEGRIDSDSAEQLDQIFQAAVASEHYKVILDLAKVRYINSVGLRILADTLTQNKQNGGDLKLSNLSPKIKRVLEIIGFDRFFSIHSTVDEALTAFAG